MSEMVGLIDRLHRTDTKGNIIIGQYSPNEIIEFNSIVLWYSEGVRRHMNRVVRFGDNVWSKKDNKNIIFSDEKSFGIEVKASILLAYKVGYVLGSDGVKWSTLYGYAIFLVRFEKYLHNLGYRSFIELNSLPEIILRNLFNNFLIKHSDSGGLGVLNIHGTGANYVESITVIYKYELINSKVYRLFNECLSILKPSHHEDDKNSHPVIPSRILKKLIKKSEIAINSAEVALPEWEELNDNLIKKIRRITITNWASPTRVSSIVRSCMTSYEYKRIKEIYKVFYKFEIYVLVYVLAFTGMRKQEALSLEFGAATKIIDSDVTIYFIKSILNKTSSSPVTLNWVGNKDVYNAVCLLERYIQSFHKKAKALLYSLGDILPETTKHNLEYGLKENYLFGVKTYTLSLAFREPKLRDSWTQGNGFNLKTFSIVTEEADIIQLNHLRCNFKSVSGSDRGVPYRIGDEFNFSAHQFRHTFAWFIIANNLGDLDDIKYQFKHLGMAMTMVYSERGIETIDEILSIINGFESQLTKKVALGLATAAQDGKLSGGGGKRLNKAAKSLVLEAKVPHNVNDKALSGSIKQIHFKDITEYSEFLAKNLENIRGLPHGYCSGGTDCKIKNAVVPVGCVMCGNYIVDEKHLPHWRAMENQAVNKLAIYENATSEQQRPYKLIADSWKITAATARGVIDDIENGCEQIKKEIKHD